MKRKIGKLLVAVVFSVCFAGVGSADLAKQIDGIISRPAQKKVRFSVHIVKADSGETVYNHNANIALVPASNMKIITTAAALKFLGADYQYKTKVGLCGDTLVVIGSGDPLLGDKVTDAKYGREAGWIFKDITARLRQNGITSIKGIIVDSSIFDDQRVHPNWPKEQLNRWYACEVSGLNFNGNCIDVTAKNIGGKVIVSIEPKTDFIKIINKVVPTRRAKGAVGAYRTRQPNKIIVKGRCKKQQGPFPVAIEGPAVFFGHLLAENLISAGINVEGQIVEKPVDEGCNVRVLGEYTSSIADCLVRCNKDSFGLAAEALLKTMAWGRPNAKEWVWGTAVHSNKNCKNGGWERGRMLISRYLSSLGIGQSEFYIDDASGLSRQNRLSANAITTVLCSVYKSVDWHYFKDSLAVGGVDGTIRKYFREEKYKGKVFGKTGYIAGVKSFSGLCGGRGGGGDYIFSILANNTNSGTRGAINDIAKAIIDSE